MSASEKANEFAKLIKDSCVTPHEEVKRTPFMMDVLCSYCELEVMTKNAWDEKVDPTEQMCVYCQREIQS